MVKGIEHVALVVRDVEAMKNWYVDFFGARVIYDNKKSPPTYFVAFENNSYVELYTAKNESDNGDNETRGYRHFALEVDNFDEMVEKVEKAGLEIVKPALKTDTGVCTMFFRDPEGNLIHFIQRVTPLV